MIHGQGEVEHEVQAEEDGVQAEQEAAVSASAPQEQTLHDFVLNLLGDAAARAAFAQNPAEALELAGLGDITTQDVQDVVPLVMDYGSLPQPGALDALPADAGGIEGAIQQLQGVADAAVGQRIEGAEDADLTAGLTSSVGEFVAGGAADLDGVSGVARWTSDLASGEGAGHVGPDGANLGAHTDTVAGRVAGIGGAGLDSAGGAATVDSLVGTGSGMADASLEGVTGDLAFESEHGNFAAFGAASADGAAGGAALDTDIIGVESSAAGSADAIAAGGSINSAFGTYGVEFTGSPTSPSLPELETTGDLADTIDTDSITRGSEAAASTVATYVTSGGAALSGLPMDNLPAEIPTDVPTDVPAELPFDRAALSDATQAVPGAGALPVDAPVDVPANLPADLPTDVSSGLPTDAVTGLASEVSSKLSTLPEDVPVDVPTDLPDLPVANPLPEPQGVTAEGTEAVTDTVSESPLGGVTQSGDDLLPETSSVSDLGLGH